MGDGHSISFWEDKWVHSLLYFRISSPKPTECDIHLVSNAIIPGLGVWNFDKLKGVLVEDEIQAIAKIALSTFPRSNNLIWHYNSQGVYTVKSGY